MCPEQIGIHAPAVAVHLAAVIPDEPQHVREQRKRAFAVAEPAPQGNAPAEAPAGAFVAAPFQ
ncbi:hypothetical protein D3C81_1902660 [compost metagenome]